MKTKPFVAKYTGGRVPHEWRFEAESITHACLRAYFHAKHDARLRGNFTSIKVRACKRNGVSIDAVERIVAALVRP